MRHRAHLVVAVIVAASCGTGPGGVAVDDPVPTLFPPGASTTAPSAIPAAPPTSSTTAPVVRVPPLDHDGEARVVVLDSGVAVPVVGRTGDGWLVRSPCGSEVEVDAASVAREVDAVHLVVDPAHGGGDRGVTPGDGPSEAEQDLELAHLLVEELERRGIEALATRHADVDLPVAARVAVARTLAVPLVVLGHDTATPGDPGAHRGDTPGTEAWYRTGDAASRRLAGVVYGELVAGLRTLGGPWWADDEAGVVHRLNQRGDDLRRPLALARDPAVVVEVAALADVDEARRLATASARRVVVTALADGIGLWLGTDAPGRGYVELEPEVIDAPTAVTTCVDVVTGDGASGD